MKEETKIIDLETHKKEKKKNEPLTVEKLKTYKGLENLTDDEAQEALFQIQVLAALIVEYQSLKENNESQINLNQAA